MTPEQITLIVNTAIELLELVRGRDEDDIIELEDFFPRIATVLDQLKEHRQARREARKE